MENIRPFDFIKTHNGSVGIVMIVNISPEDVGNPTTYSIEWIHYDEPRPKTAWWYAHEIEPLKKNMMDMFAKGVAGPCGTRGYKEHFGIDRY